MINKDFIEANQAHIARWQQDGVGTIPEIQDAINLTSHEHRIKVCNSATKRHVGKKCQELLNSIKLPERHRAKEEKLTREIVDMLVYERLVYTEDGDGSTPEKSPVNVVAKSGLPQPYVSHIVNNPGWNYWFKESPI